MKSLIIYSETYGLKGNLGKYTFTNLRLGKGTDNSQQVTSQNILGSDSMKF